MSPHIFDKDVKFNGNVTIMGTCTTINTEHKIINTTEYNPITKNIELSNFILQQFKKYDEKIEELENKIIYLQDIITDKFNLTNY